MHFPISVTMVLLEYSSSSWSSPAPVIEGVVDVIPNAVYDLKVEILQTHFGDPSQYADVYVRGKYFYSLGKCHPPSTECSSWHRCSLNTKPLTSKNGKLRVSIRFSYGVDLSKESCDTNAVTASVTFELKGNCIQQFHGNLYS